MQVEKAANHYWNFTLRPVNIGILIRFSCLFGSFDMATDDTCFVFNLISDVTLATLATVDCCLAQLEEDRENNKNFLVLVKQNKQP